MLHVALLVSQHRPYTKLPGLKACIEDQSCCFPQAPTRLHFDLLLSQTQNEGRGHRDVQIRSNQEFPSAFCTEIAKHPSLLATLPARQKPLIQWLPVPRAWAEHLSAGKR